MFTLQFKFPEYNAASEDSDMPLYGNRGRQMEDTSWLIVAIFAPSFIKRGALNGLVM